MLANDRHSALQSSDYPADAESDINPSPIDTSCSSRPSTPFYDGLPANFGDVVRGVYRSSFPQATHVNSLKNLKLQTIISLVDEKWCPEMIDFSRKHTITSHVIPIMPNKESGVSSPQSVIDKVLRIIIEPRNHPILIHCNKGRHRTGCIVACLRKLQHWPITAILAEYQKYAAPKARALDMTFIQSYDPSVLGPVVDSMKADLWLPDIFSMPVDYPVLEAFLLPGKKSEPKQLDSPPPERGYEQLHDPHDLKPL
ncbi:hypothetical protein KEM54_006921 [Ascosphaera aggregata]|nr:hypothetical protein KEM54_006921 [Ascosphaera aggregata]